MSREYIAKGPRQAELAVEHLVQEHGIDRNAVTIRASGEANSAGTRPAGADVESGHPGGEKHGAPALAGKIEVQFACGTGQTEAIHQAIRQAGGQKG